MEEEEPRQPIKLTTESIENAMRTVELTMEQRIKRQIEYRYTRGDKLFKPKAVTGDILSALVDWRDTTLNRLKDAHDLNDLHQGGLPREQRLPEALETIISALGVDHFALMGVFGREEHVPRWKLDIQYDMQKWANTYIPLITNATPANLEFVTRKAYTAAIVIIEKHDLPDFGLKNPLWYPHLLMS